MPVQSDKNCSAAETRCYCRRYRAQIRLETRNSDRRYPESPGESDNFPTANLRGPEASSGRVRVAFRSTREARFSVLRDSDGSGTSETSIFLSPPVNRPFAADLH